MASPQTLPIQDLTQFLSEAIRKLGPNFYGSLEIKFEAGRAVLVKKTETIKPSGEGQARNYRDNRGGSDGRNF